MQWRAPDAQRLPRHPARRLASTSRFLARESEEKFRLLFDYTHRP
jgi:hypothetical protein